MSAPSLAVPAPAHAPLTIAEIQKPVRRELERVQERLRESFHTPIPILNQVGGYVLATRGKKFRPTLLLLVARLGGPVSEDALYAATVVEMVHAAALIHDDSVDKSDLRRGRPTVNGLWTNEMAIIMGDYLYAQSMSLLVRHKLSHAMDVLSRVVAEMSCGEALEFQYAYDLDVTQEQYEELIQYKTGSLIGAATEMGADLSNAPGPRDRRLHFRRFGDRLGVAFQIADDLLDYLGSPKVTGKPVGSDLAEGKVTLPLIAALRNATEADRRVLKRLALRKRWTPAQWSQLLEMVEKCGGFESARARALELAAEARRLAQADPSAPRSPRTNGTSTPALRAVRRALERAVDYSVQRKY
jgi:octaprenyl-diphosphate synthase